MYYLRNNNCSDFYLSIQYEIVPDMSVRLLQNTRLRSSKWVQFFLESESPFSPNSASLENERN